LKLSTSHAGSLSSSGSEFQTVGPATGEAQGRPYVLSRQRGTMSICQSGAVPVGGGVERLAVSRRCRWACLQWVSGVAERACTNRRLDDELLAIRRVSGDWCRSIDRPLAFNRLHPWLTDTGTDRLSRPTSPGPGTDLRETTAEQSGLWTRGGFRHVQQVRPNREGPTKMDTTDLRGKVSTLGTWKP